MCGWQVKINKKETTQQKRSSMSCKFFNSAPVFLLWVFTIQSIRHQINNQMNKSVTPSLYVKSFADFSLSTTESCFKRTSNINRGKKNTHIVHVCSCCWCNQRCTTFTDSSKTMIIHHIFKKEAYIQQLGKGSEKKNNQTSTNHSIIRLKNDDYAARETPASRTSLPKSLSLNTVEGPIS